MMNTPQQPVTVEVVTMLCRGNLIYENGNATVTAHESERTGA